jgi:hypothetical protein
MARPVLVSVKVYDIEGIERSYPLYLDSTQVTTLAHAQAAFDAAIPTLYGPGGISDAGVKSATVEFPLSLAAISLVNPAILLPNSVGRLDAGATISFNNEINRAYSHYVPAFKQSKMSNGVVNLTDADVAAFINMMVTDATNRRFTDAFGLNVTSTRKGKMSTR